MAANAPLPGREGLAAGWCEARTALPHGPTHPRLLPSGEGGRNGDAGRFTEGASRLAGLAGVAFGWMPDAFWRSTPAELGALVRAAAGENADGVDSDTLARLMEAFPDG